MTREPHPTDRRATLVTLTGPGDRSHQLSVREREEFAHLLLAAMPPKRLESFVGGLEDVLAKLKQLKAAAQTR